MQKVKGLNQEKKNEPLKEIMADQPTDKPPSEPQTDMRRELTLSKKNTYMYLFIKIKDM